MSDHAIEIGRRFDAALAAQGIRPSAADLERMRALYVGLAPAIAAMHALEAAREEQPALGFAAAWPPPTAG